VSLCSLLSSIVCQMSVSTSHSTDSWFCVTMSIAVFYSLSIVCQYLTQYRPPVMCYNVHCSLLQFDHSPSIPHTVPSLRSGSLCPLLSSKFCPISVYISHCTLCWFCVNMSIADFYSLSKVCQCLTHHGLMILCH
jgi:hypothetical protein